MTDDAMAPLERVERAAAADLVRETPACAAARIQDFEREAIDPGDRLERE